VRPLTGTMRGRPLAAFAFTAAVAALAGSAGADAVRGASKHPAACPPIASEPAYRPAVLSALAQREDVWGNQVLSSPQGPSYDAVNGRLHPLFLVGHPAGLKPKRLTDSGVYYLPFGQPIGAGGAGHVDLHVADGSQVVSQLVNGPKMTVYVGAHGGERYGSCLSRLDTPALYGGYLPVLETSYHDVDGVRYQQESFATRIPQTRSLVSFVRVSVDPTGSRVRNAYVRFTPSIQHLKRVRMQLRQRGRARLLFSKGVRVDGRSLVYAARRPRVVYVAWLNEPRRTRTFPLNRKTYERAKASLVAYWTRRLATGADLVVPEQRVYDAERNLLIQNMLMSWRYSLGNSYGHFSWELADVAEVMGAYGYRGIERAILGAALHAATVFPNRAAGEQMTASADYFRRFGDRAYITKVTPRFRRVVESFVRQIAADRPGLLRPERYGSDIAGPIYGLHTQVLALQGLRGMAAVWAQAGWPGLATEATDLATRLEVALRAAVSAARTTLPDGSVFVPIELVNGHERPYDHLPSSKRGSYWNLVMPYALASGFFRPESADARGLLRYMLEHGSRFLGLVRFAPHTGVTNPGYQMPGSDDVYGTNVARFLADNDQPEQLLLSLYGKLAAGMTENTFVAGEGSTIGPVRNQYYRYMHRPPNSANNAFFLEALRLALAHETTDANDLPQGLVLAYSTSRDWLEPGKRIDVRRLQTSFGPLSYSIAAGSSALQVDIYVPGGLHGPLRLRLRLPAGERIGAVTVNGAPFSRFVDPETLDLTGLTSHIQVTATREFAPAG
jgi:hypothetical protein